MKKILLDCDPGHDDMMAIMLASVDSNIEVLGLTTVAGNQTGDKTFINARSILTLLGREDIPLARGADKPLTRELVVAPEIHGKSGLDGAELPEPLAPYLDCHAADFIIDTLKASEEKVTLVPTGPLTNVALALIKAPEIREKISDIVLMGGGVYDSNITPAAEFNIYVDPEAARIVFQSGVPLTMIGLDVTNKAAMTFEQIADMSSWGGRISSIVGPLMEFFARANRDNLGINGAPIHDALAVAAVINPGLVGCKNLYVDIETQGELTRGQTVADVYGVTGRLPNCRVALTVDTPAFISLMQESIKKLDEK